VLVGRDEFTGTTAGGTLNGRVAPAGGTWATSGSTTDFSFADGPGTGVETLSRATGSDASPRFAILGSTTYTNTEAGVSYARASSALIVPAVILRWTDSSNYLAVRHWFATSYDSVVEVIKVVAGTPTTIASTPVPTGSETGFDTTWVALRAVVFASGVGAAWLAYPTGGVFATVNFSDTVLATGGTLASGKVGFQDYFPGGFGAVTRNYDNFYAATPAPEPIAVYSGRAAEIRSDSAERQDSTGTYYGGVPEYRGGRFMVPCAGTRGRKTRVAVVARRNDTVVAPDDAVTDSTTVTVAITPRYLVVPRA
jgi:hypothetical protein